MAKLRLRIAPSPTGPVHVGTAHTALFNWLWARSLGGDFVLRLEDTDRERSRPDWEQLIFEELTWLGLDWDEGPDVGGPFGPYRQSERLPIYWEYLEHMRTRGTAYLCYCTPDELAAERAEAQRQGVAYQYSRRCRNLSERDRAQFEAQGRTGVWRFAAPDGGTVGWDDLVRGRIEFAATSTGDVVIMRANGVPLYNFAVVVDDAAMAITHVVRGEDHISNTPVQILLYEALGLQPPAFGHLGNLTNADRSKMSKRMGHAQIQDYRERGILPAALLNFLALLGWTPADGREFLTKEQMIQEFRMEDVTKAAAVFDLEKLEWMNGNYVRSLDLESFLDLSIPFLVRSELITAQEIDGRRPWLKEVLAQIQERIRTLREIPDAINYFIRDDFEVDPKTVAKFLGPDAQPFLRQIIPILDALPDWNLSSIEGVIRGLMTEMNLQPKESMQPLRVALTGRTASPGLFETVYLVGKERTLARLRRHT